MERPTAGTIVLLLLSVLFNVITHLLVKKAMLEIGHSPSQVGGLPGFLLHAFLHPKVILGAFFTILTIACWMIALSRTALSFAYPFYALAIVLVLALSPFLFKETVRWNQWIGVALVCVGIWVASRLP